MSLRRQLYETPTSFIIWIKWHTCLLYCIKPSVGKTQVATAGKSSWSAKFTYCWINAPSNGLFPRSWSLDTDVNEKY